MRKRGGEAMRKAAELPFRVDRNLRTNLVDQVVDGFHQAIRSGIYRPGDTIPTVRALAPQLGVSVRVTAEAVKALAAKGLVAPRPRLGSVVLPRNATLWNGTVVLILPDGYGYSQTEMSSRVRQALVGAGYLCMQFSACGLRRPNVRLQGGGESSASARRSVCFRGLWGLSVRRKRWPRVV